MNYLEYSNEIKLIAYDLVNEAMTETENDREAAMYMINDYMLHETIDGHLWVIYYSYYDEVIKQSDDDEYYRDICDNESIRRIVTEKGLDYLKKVIACWCMCADVQEMLDESFDEFEAKLE